MACQELEKVCLTCFKKNESTEFVTSEETPEILKLHFWFTDANLEQASICLSCWEQVSGFHRFYVSVEALYFTRLDSVIIKSEPVVQENQEENMPVVQEHKEEIVPVMQEHQEESVPVVQEHQEESVPPQVKTDAEQQESKSKEQDEATGSTAKSNCQEYRHESDEGKKLNFECDHCGVTFTQRRVLYTHVRRKHADKPKLTCDVCSKPFRLQSWLQNHKRQFHTIRSVLDKPIKLKHRKQMWKQLDIEEEMVQCAICMQWFVNINSLRTHVKVHKQTDESIELTAPAEKRKSRTER